LTVIKTFITFTKEYVQPGSYISEYFFKEIAMRVCSFTFSVVIAFMLLGVSFKGFTQTTPEGDKNIVKKDIGEAVVSEIKSSLRPAYLDLLASSDLASWSDIKNRLEAVQKATEAFVAKYTNDLMGEAGGTPAVTPTPTVPVSSPVPEVVTPVDPTQPTVVPAVVTSTPVEPTPAPAVVPATEASVAQPPVVTPEIAAPTVPVAEPAPVVIPSTPVPVTTPPPSTPVAASIIPPSTPELTPAAVPVVPVQPEQAPVVTPVVPVAASVPVAPVATPPAPVTAPAVSAPTTPAPASALPPVTGVAGGMPMA